MKKTKYTEFTLIIPKTNVLKDTSKPPLPPPPPPTPYGYYGCFNFIFDEDGTLYFYQHFYDYNKAPVRVIDYNSPAPIFIHLIPDQIIILPNAGIKKFFEDNILHTNQAYRSVRIIGMTDTIKSKALQFIMNQLTDTSNHLHYSIRMATFEEKTVLDYKKKGKFYNPDKINWDYTKVFFDLKQRE